MKKLVVFASALLLVWQTAWAASVKIGVLMDESGGTGDVGKPYGEGIKDAVLWFNDNGGINGDKIDMIYVDYAYKIPQAISAYKQFKSQNVVAVHGWGTGDTEAMVKFVTETRFLLFPLLLTALTEPTRRLTTLSSPTYGARHGSPEIHPRTARIRPSLPLQ